MSTHVEAIIPVDDDWHKNKAVWDACKAAGIEVPEKVQDFFQWREPDPEGSVVDIPSTEWSDNQMRAGIEVRIADLPPHVKIVRFYNSY